jgi:uncharacterized protein (TIGR04255 family)
MAEVSTFQFDLDEQFPHLPSAPIVEAVIQWRARAETAWEVDPLRQQLSQRLSDYPTCQPQHEMQFEAQFVGHDSPTPQRRVRWLGFRLVSADGRYIAQFNRDGLVFSRLEPYNEWETFSSEGLRIWKTYLDLAGPVEVQRLGVRFVNRIALAKLAQLSRYLARPPKCLEPLGLPVSRFLYQSIHDVPGHPFQINVAQTVQPPSPPQTEGFGLILDIDVSTTQSFDCDEKILIQHLEKMRLLKDKAFFSLLKPKAIESFQGDKK